MANIKRLKRLVTVLERVMKDPKKRWRFDLSYWGIKTPSCGTHLCACGWAAMDPVLSKQGLALVRDRDGISAGLLKLKFGRKYHMGAAASFFDITTNTAHHLFNRLAYGSGTAMRPVINRIKSVIKEAEKA